MLWLALALVLVAAPAWAQTPTLVQRVGFGALAPSQGLSARTFTIRLPNRTLAGNALVLITDYDSGATVSTITDDGGGTWSNTPVVSASASGTLKTEAYVLANAATGTRTLAITYSKSVSSVHFVALEYYNVATSGAVGSTAGSTAARAPSIASGTLQPAPASSGSLVLHYAMNNQGVIGESNSVHQVSSWVAGPGFTLEAADYASGNSGQLGAMNPFGLETRIADGTNFSPTLTTTGTETYNAIAFELKAASAGTAPPPGIRIQRMQFFTNLDINLHTWTEPFPCSGNLLAFTEIQGNIQSAMSDNQGNTWTVDNRGSLNSEVALQHAGAAITSSTYVWSAPIPAPGNGNNTTLVMYDITGADTAAPFVQVVTASADASNKTSFGNAPTITPRNPNGLVVVATAIGQGPLTGLAAAAPATAFFMPVTYAGETDFDSFNNADGYAVNYYGSSLATQNYAWTMKSTPNDGYYAAAAEFRAAAGPRPSPPTQFQLSGDPQLDSGV